MGRCEDEMHLPYKHISGAQRLLGGEAVIADCNLPIRTASCIFLSFSVSMIAGIVRCLVSANDLDVTERGGRG